MKEVKAIIQPHMLARVMERLHQLPHFPGVTVSGLPGSEPRPRPIGAVRADGGEHPLPQDDPVGAFLPGCQLR